MSLPAATGKLLLFGLIGGAGCLLGSLIAEPLIRWGESFRDRSTAGRAAGGLVSKPEPPPEISRAEAPPPPPEIQRDLDAAGARTGDIQISLSWRNRNDLDLYCIDPNGEQLYFVQKKASKSSGWLDVDANVDSPTDRPVENIFWPYDEAPRGRYTVKVKHYKRREDDLTPFQVSVKVGTRRTEYEGTVALADFKTVTEFTWPPSAEVRLAVPQVMAINGGGVNAFGVRIARSYFDGPVTVRLEGDLAGLRPPPAITIPARDDFAEIPLEADRAARSGRRDVRVVASADGADVASQSIAIDVHPAVTGGEVAFSWLQPLIVAIWTSLLAIGLGLALIVGQNIYLKRHPLTFVQATIALAGGMAAGGLSGGLAEAGFAVAQVSTGLAGDGLLLTLGRIAGWAVLGGILGRGMGMFVPNLPAARASIAGGIGGMLGGIAFLAAANLMGYTPARWAGAAVLGIAIGLMVALVEAVCRQYWLEVDYGSREQRLVTLGVAPVTIGADANCSIYSRGGPPVALRYHVEQGGVICEDVSAGRRQRVTLGDQRTAGSLRLTVRGSSASTAGSAAAPARSSTGAKGSAVAAPASGAAPFTLWIAGERSIPLPVGRTLSPVDVPGLQPGGHDGVVAEVVANPSNPNLLGLRNHSQQSWSMTAGGESRTVDPGQTVRLAAGVRLKFGFVSGDIRV